MKICVFGAGAIGCAIAARLAAAGFTTAVLARGAALQAIRANGVRFEVGGATAVGQVAASDDPAALGPQDVVIATVKAHDLPGSAGAIGALLHARSAVVYAVNGVPWWYFHGVGGDADGRKIVRLDPVGALWDEVGVQRAIGCVVNFASSLAAPGAAHGEGPNNRLALGEPKGGASARLREIVAALRTAGFEVDADAPIRREVWTKLRRTVASSTVAALTGLDSGATARDPALRRTMRAAMQEIAATAAAHGYPLDDDIDVRLEQQTKGSHKPSLLQDLEAGKRVEIAAQLVAPLELAREAGVPVPTVEILAALLAARARAAGLYDG